MKSRINPDFLRFACEETPCGDRYLVERLNIFGPWSLIKVEAIVPPTLTVIVLAIAALSGYHPILIMGGVLIVLTTVILVQALKKVSQANDSLNSYVHRLGLHLKDLGIQAPLTVPTHILYAMIREAFYKKAALIKYWEKNDKERASQLRDRFHDLISTSQNMFGYFDTTGGHRAFFGEKSDKVMVDVASQLALSSLNTGRCGLDRIAGTSVNIESFARVLKQAVGHPDNKHTVNRLLQLLVPDEEQHEAILHEYRKA